MFEKKFNWVQGVPVLEEISADTTDNGRFYTTPTGIYPSVTTVLSVLPKDGIARWKERVGEEEATRILHQAGVRGTAIHNMAEAYLKGEDWRHGAMPANIMSFKPIQKVLYEHVDDVYYIEAPLYSKYLRTAGRVDLIAKFDGIRSVIDFKTSRINKTENMIENYFMQESAYSVMFEELTGKGIRQLVTIMTSDDSPKALVFIRDRDEWISKFMEARSLYDEQKATH